MKLKHILLIIFGVIYFNSETKSQLLCKATSIPKGGYASIVSSGLDYESPDCVHTDFGPHITQVYDSLLSRYVFLFHSHIEKDNDRCENFDRVRMEIKGGPNTSPEAQHQLNTTSYYRWKFRLPLDFKGSSSFCHIFQNKIYGGSDTDLPVITLTPRANVLEVIHNGGSTGNDLGKVASVDIALLKGRWIEAYIKEFHSEQGKIEVELKDLITKEILLSYKNENIDLWRTGAEYSRPKWGIYRLKSAELKDETVRFADFCISEVAELLCPSENFILPDNIPPSAPNNLISTSKSRYSIDLEWDSSTDNIGVVKYIIKRNESNFDSVNLTLYSDTNLSAGKLYSYVVYAVDFAGNISGPSNIISIETDSATVLPGVPTLISPANQSENLGILSILKWAKSNNAISYRVYFGTENAPGLILDTIGISCSPILNPNTKYYWQIGAINENGESKSPVWSFTTGDSNSDLPWYVYRANNKMHVETNFWELNSIPDMPLKDQLFDDPNGSGNKYYGYEDDSDMNFRWRFRLTDKDTAITIVARVKALSPSINGICFFEIRGFGWREKLRLNQSTLKLERASPVIEVNHPFNWNDEFHIIRITMKGKVTHVYLDENPIPIAVGSSGESTTSNYVEWGKSGPGPYASLIDWMAIDRQNAYPPGEGKALPNDLFISSDATLSEIKFNAKNVDGFNSYVYTYNIPVSGTFVPNISFKTTSELATSEIIHPLSAPNTFSKINVSAQDGFTKKIYTLNYVSASGNSELYKQNEISTFPNPSSNLLHVKSNNGQTGNYYVMDILGNRIMTSSFVHDFDIDVSELKKGIYLLVLSYKYGKIFNKKIIIK